MIEFIPLIKPGVDMLKGGLRLARRELSTRKYDQLVSAVITELLKENPDVTAAEAQLAAAQATGAKPDMQLLRAQSMLRAVKIYVSDRVDTGARGRRRLRGAAKRKAKPVRRRAARRKRK
jgi:hypothetical protein